MITDASHATTEMLTRCPPSLLPGDIPRPPSPPAYTPTPICPECGYGYGSVYDDFSEGKQVCTCFICKATRINSIPTRPTPPVSQADPSPVREPSKAITTFASGAVRSADAAKVRYDLISPFALQALAETYAEGSAKYGDYNWEKGIPAHDMINHALRHIFAFLKGDQDEPHLAHAFWNLGAAIHSVEMWPELNEPHLRRQGCLPPIGVLPQ